MAARAGANPSDTSGKYVLNRSMSTPHDDVLAAQGVSWLQRTAIAIASVTIELKHTFTTQPPVETITFQNTATGGIKGTSGIYYFPSKEFKHSDHVFGAVLIQTERKSVSSITNSFLKQGWTEDVETTPFDNVEGVLWTYTVPDKSQGSTAEWSAEQVWGYAEHDIPGVGIQKRYTRRVHFTSPSLTKDLLLVYEQKDVESTASASSTSHHEEEDLSSFGAS